MTGENECSDVVETGTKGELVEGCQTVNKGLQDGGLGAVTGRYALRRCSKPKGEVIAESWFSIVPLNRKLVPRGNSVNAGKFCNIDRCFLVKE